MAVKVLVVDDEKMIVKGLRFSLQQDGYEVECAYDGEEALGMIRERQYDIVLLDVMLPKLSGFEVLQQVREFSDVPVIMLTARGDDMDKILGLDYGADDYVTKPFNPLEVKGRIKAIIRRTSRARKAEEVKENIIEVGDLRMDLDNRRVTLSDKEINLTSKEFELLELLATHAGKVYSRAMLLQMVWGKDKILETSEQSMYISGACAKRLSTMLPNLNMSRQNGESDTISAATKGKKR